MLVAASDGGPAQNSRFAVAACAPAPLRLVWKCAAGNCSAIAAVKQPAFYTASRNASPAMAYRTKLRYYASDNVRAK